MKKNGWKGTLSLLEFNPIGLLDPVWWRNNKWTITKAEIINGKRKCKEKNRVNVALPTENPPHIHSTIDIPK